MPAIRTGARATVIALTDGAGAFFQPRQQAFPDASAEHWRAADTLDPAAVTTDRRWWLRFRCFAIRLTGGRTVLVDTGIGPAGSPASGWAPVPGDLPAELAAAGIDPAGVTAVVLTHLHTDHVGWAVTEHRPFFGNARYLLQRAEHDALDQAAAGLREALIDPLRASGQLSLVDGDSELATGVRVVATPGHTPGHQSVLVDTGDELVAVAGDLLVHAVQLVDPELRYALEVDPDAARTSRAALLAELVSRGGLLATAHLSEPFLAPATPTGWAPARPR
ncbi:MAG: MBL fold metallo-hydrolase [Micromonosporaceae bacterium]|nr:MBL fold metallo-hydrolase [Micromonosporaceae bacterium]